MKGLIILIAVATVAGIIGFLLTSGLLSDNSDKKASEKTFSASGITITLTDEFQKQNVKDYDFAYGTEDVAVFALKEEFSLMDGFEDYTLDQYLDLVIQANKLSSDNIKKTDGLIGFVYDFTNPDTNEAYRYFSYTYKADDAFWLVQFAVLSKNADQYEAQIIEWAKSVDFAN